MFFVIISQLYRNMEYIFTQVHVSIHIHIYHIHPISVRANKSVIFLKREKGEPTGLQLI